MSGGQVKSLEERYDYICNESVPLEDRWPDPPRVVLPLLHRLKALGVVLLADSPKWDIVSVKTPRVGSAVIVPNRPTLIWINFVRHYMPNTRNLNVPELIDTIAHEAIHTTGISLGRFSVQPEDVSTDAYKAEEVCALAGTAAIHQSMGNAFAATQNKRAAQSEASKLADLALRRPAIDRGNEAARFLLTSNGRS